MGERGASFKYLVKAVSCFRLRAGKTLGNNNSFGFELEDCKIMAPKTARDPLQPTPPCKDPAGGLAGVPPAGSRNPG